MIKHQLSFASFLLLIALFTQANAAQEINTLEKSAFFKFKEGAVAIRGYDTVAYFESGKAKKGKRTFQVTWRGAIWRFSS